ncbi:isochorismatase family protein [Lacipirellula limnantheis]|uniref:Isochorismatase family protein n=1 Tax=Lacipirellula limnantheis TaxID=2528024 RepID=A0A517U5G5_9BACT|nr:isochorismatase family protein [Lacipirellula limnantheis]QDT75868.1 Isochorismatase family protein [Lacipirellula limnantheis]
MKLIICMLALMSLGAIAWAETGVNRPMLTFHTRGMKPQTADGKTFLRTEETVEWDPQRTALIVVDMWDDHWCRGAAERVVEMAGPLNEFVAKARDAGVLVVHAPSTCVDFYNDSPARQRAIRAPHATPPGELAAEQRWGTAWDYPDEPREPPMPIDDSDMGCDCAVKCEISAPWKRQIASIEIDDKRDAVTDNGQELVNLFAERGIDNVIICGVHLNMCVLGRPFAIRQLVKMGKNVVLVRDLTDTMYNHEMAPHVDHFTGTDLVVEHVEKYWCPTIVSSDLTGGEPFRFAASK